MENVLRKHKNSFLTSVWCGTELGEVSLKPNFQSIEFKRNLMCPKRAGIVKKSPNCRIGFLSAIFIVFTIKKPLKCIKKDIKSLQLVENSDYHEYLLLCQEDFISETQLKDYDS